MGYKVNNRVNTEGFPFYLVEGILKSDRVDTFVELGTAGGDTIKTAAKCFKKCYTIEIIENRAIVDKSIENIKWLTGNTVDILPTIIDDLLVEKALMQKGVDPIYNYSVFWIDSHYSDPEPNTSQFTECPLMEELEIISLYQHDAIILIDDARLFMGHPPAPLNPKEWPMIQDIFVLLKEKFPFNYSSLVDDFIISIPERLREPIDAEWRGNYSTRYPTHENNIKMQVKNVYNEFKKYLE